MQTLSNLFNLRKAALLIGIYCLINLSAFAQQPGEVDTSFNPSDAGFGQGLGPSSTVRQIFRQTDGKIVLSGSFDSYNATLSRGIARINPDGTPDSTLNLGTGFDGFINAIALQADGKLLVGGLFTDYNGVSRSALVRLNTDGSLDQGFDPQGFTDVDAIAVQADGKVIIAALLVGGRQRVLRLNTDGSLDTTFIANTKDLDGGLITTLHIQADGKILVGGGFPVFDGIASPNLFRLNKDGSLDRNFTNNLGTGFNNFIHSIDVQSDNKILVGGAFTSFNGNLHRGLLRLNADGSLDTGFGIGSGFDNFVNDVLINPNGQLLVLGNFSTFNANPQSSIIRLNSNGSIDNSFQVKASGQLDAGLLLPNGQILIGGLFFSIEGAEDVNLALLNSDGSQDNTFNSPTGFNSSVNDVIVLDNDKILVGGSFTNFNGVSRRNIARLNANGSLDTNFDPGTGFNLMRGRRISSVNTIVRQGDGKIVAGGAFESFNGTSRNSITRLNANGSLDTSFDPGTGFDGEVVKILLLPNGQLLVGGDFIDFNGNSRNRIARLNADGSLDTSFNPGTGFDGEVLDMVLLPNSRYLVTGIFSSYNGLSIPPLVILNADGSLESNFNPNFSNLASINALTVQGDGKFLVGATSFLPPVISASIFRFNQDGSPDTEFNSSTFVFSNSVLENITLQADGKILVGAVNFIGNNIGSTLTRLNPNGTLDNNFVKGRAVNGVINITALQANGKIIVGGGFGDYNGIGRNSITRLFGGDPVQNNRQEVTEFVLVNPVTDQEIGSLTNNQSINLDDYEQQQGTKQFNIVAKTSPSSVGSVVFSLTGSINENRTENAAPYALFGDSNGNFRGKTLQLGSYNLKATPFSRSQRRGDEGQELSIQFQVVETPSNNQVTLNTSAGNGGSVSPNGSNNFNPGTQVSVTATPNNGFQFKNFTFGNGNVASTSNPYTFTINANVTLVANFEAVSNNGSAVTSFTLINANTEQPIAGFNPIPNNAQIDINNIPNVPLNIQANTTPNNVGSVGFALRGAQNSDERENLAPYLLFDSGSSLNIVQDQNYTLTATPFSQRGLKGNAGTPLTISFSFVDGTPPPASGNAVTSFSLINANTGQVINGFETIPNNAQIDVGQIGTNLVNIQANTNPSVVGSVGFEISGDRTSSERENVEPYWLFDRRNELNVNAGESFTVKATPFSERGLKGEAGSSLTINFSFINGLSLNAFPNPSTNSVTLTANSNAEQVQVEIYCPYRGMVYQQSFPGKFQTEINMKELGAGMYVCKMMDSQGAITEQTLIVK